MLKVDPTGSDVRALLAGEPVERCVRASYRTALVAPGDPVLLWVSGRDATWPAGIHGLGHVLGPVDHDRAGRPAMTAALERLDPPVLRGELLTHPAMGGLEVLRMAAGSNPSFLSRAQLATLRRDWPQVEAAQARAALGP